MARGIHEGISGGLRLSYCRLAQRDGGLSLRGTACRSGPRAPGSTSSWRQCHQRGRCRGLRNGGSRALTLGANQAHQLVARRVRALKPHHVADLRHVPTLVAPIALRLAQDNEKLRIGELLRRGAKTLGAEGAHARTLKDLPVSDLLHRQLTLATDRRRARAVDGGDSDVNVVLVGRGGHGGEGSAMRVDTGMGCDRAGSVRSVSGDGEYRYSGRMGFNYKTDSDYQDDERRKRRSEELARIIPGLSADEITRAVERWCSMLGSQTSMDEVDRGTFADFRTGLGFDGLHQMSS